MLPPWQLPLPGNYLGIVYKGGVIVPILMTILLIVITFTIERFITITKAKGKIIAFIDDDVVLFPNWAFIFKNAGIVVDF